MRLLIIPEDPTLDQYILKPVVQQIFQDLGRKARVDVLTDPHLRGVQQALDRRMVADIIRDNAMIDLFLLMVDRDCDEKRAAKVSDLVEGHPGMILAVLAREEVEVWALALHRKALGKPWRDVREHCHPKEEFFEPFVERQKWLETVGKGRKRAMRNLGQGWRGLLKVCPEIAELKQQVAEWLASRPAN